MGNFYMPPVRSDELYHFGVMGMKWGVRRYQPYPKNYTGDGREVGEARRTQDKIRNATQLDNSFKTYDNYYNVREITDLGYKKDIRDARKDCDKKFNDAVDATWTKSNELAKTMYDKNGKANDDNPVIQYFKKQGYNLPEGTGGDPSEDSYIYIMDNLDKHPDIKSKWDTVNEAQSKEQEAISRYTDKLLGNLGNVRVSKSKDMGTVKQIANKVVSENAGHVIYQNKQALKNAKENDRYDITFLEAIQNREDLEGSKNKSKLLKEYETYLDDPDEYWKHRNG